MDWSHLSSPFLVAAFPLFPLSKKRQQWWTALNTCLHWLWRSHYQLKQLATATTLTGELFPHNVLIFLRSLAHAAELFSFSLGIFVITILIYGVPEGRHVQTLIATYKESYCKALQSTLDLGNNPDFRCRVDTELTAPDCQSPQSAKLRQQPQATCPPVTAAWRPPSSAQGTTPPHCREDRDAKIPHLPSKNSATETNRISEWPFGICA